jgi:hypothetical protein
LKRVTGWRYNQELIDDPVSLPLVCLFSIYRVVGGVPDGIVPEGAAPDGAVPFISPPCPPPEGAVPFISPPGGVPDGIVPEGAVLFVCSPGVPEGVASFPPACCVSAEDGVDDETALPVDWVEVLEVLVQPAIMIPAMRIVDAINMTILLFFMK